MSCLPCSHSLVGIAREHPWFLESLEPLRILDFLVHCLSYVDNTTDTVQVNELILIKSQQNQQLISMLVIV